MYKVANYNRWLMVSTVASGCGLDLPNDLTGQIKKECTLSSSCSCFFFVHRFSAITKLCSCCSLRIPTRSMEGTLM